MKIGILRDSGKDMIGMTMKMLFVTPKGLGGIYSQTELLVNQINQFDRRASLFVSSHLSGVRTLLSMWRIVLFAFTVAVKKPDIVILELSRKGSTYRKILYSKVCILFRVPFIVHLHGGGYQEYYSSSSLLLRNEIKRLFFQAAGVVLMHQGQMEFAQEILGKQRNQKLSIIPNGVQTVSSNPYQRPARQDRLRLVFLGNISDAKGIPELLRAVERFSPTELSLTLVGPMKLNQKGQDLLDSCSQKNLVTFLGPMRKEDAISQLSQSHVLILPSKIENFPNVILEAFSLGVPVIATSVGGVSTMVRHDQTGWLIPFPSDLEEEIVKSLEDVLSKKENLDHFSKEVFESARKKYSMDAVAISLQNFCEDVLAGTLDLAKLREITRTGKKR